MIMFATSSPALSSSLSSSLPELASESSSALSSMPFAKFAKAVGDYRTVQNVMLVTPVKGW